MTVFDYTLTMLSRAAEEGFPWSVSPAEAAALVAEVERLRAEAHELRLMAEEAARAENANAEDAKKERAAVVAWLRKHWSEVLEQTPQQTAKLIERGDHHREEE